MVKSGGLLAPITLFMCNNHFNHQMGEISPFPDVLVRKARASFPILYDSP